MCNCPIVASLFEHAVTLCAWIYLVYPDKSTRILYCLFHIPCSHSIYMRYLFIFVGFISIHGDHPVTVNEFQRIISHDDVIKWKHFPRYWPSVRGIHRSPVNSSHKGQKRGALMFSLILARINGWVNNGEASDLRHHRAHYDVIVMYQHKVTANTELHEQLQNFLYVLKDSMNLRSG